MREYHDRISLPRCETTVSAGVNQALIHSSIQTPNILTYLLLMNARAMKLFVLTSVRGLRVEWSSVPLGRL